MYVSVLTNSFIDWDLETILDWIPESAPQIKGVEIGTGGYEQRRHCDPQSLLADRPRAMRLRDELADRGLELCAFNVSGNPVHPNPRLAALYDADLRATLELADLMGVNRVVAMSGCPAAGPSDGTAPHFVAGDWLPDYEGLLEWQWSERILPYWTALGAEVRRMNPELRICLELIPGMSVYNLWTFDRIQSAVPELTVNLDPSHFFWQGADPLSIIRQLGGRIGFAHGKDTLIQTGQRDLIGVLDARIPYAEPQDLPWVFATPGDSHDVTWWASFVRDLISSGYDGAVSIEYEDPYRSPEDGVAAAAETLATAISAVESSSRSTV